MKFSVDRICDCLEEVKPLLKKHWEESEDLGFPLDPDYELYLRIEREGLTRSFSVRDNGKIVGYAVFIVRHHPHYRTVVTANADVIFIEKEFRGGKSFIEWCIEQLKVMGVKVVVYNVKIKNRSFQEIVFVKEI